MYSSIHELTVGVRLSVNKVLPGGGLAMDRISLLG